MAAIKHSILTLLWLLPWVLAQGLPPSSNSSLPTCAMDCMTTAYSKGICVPQDQACVCTNEQFNQIVELCVGQSCTAIEALETKNISMNGCHSPVRDRSQEHVTLSITIMAIGGLCVIARFACKIFIAQLGLGWDDWTILIATIFGLTSVVFTVVGTTANGLGKDLWTLTPKQITDFGLYFYLMAWSYYLEVALIKLSVLLFYMRIFPSRTTRNVLWVTIAFTVLWGFSFVVTSLFLCQPVSFNWKRWDGTHSGKCVNINAVTLSNAIIGIVLDFWMLAIPLREVRQLKLDVKKKIGVSLMFGVGAFVTIVSIIRLRYLISFAETTNFTWDFFDASLWSSVEVCVGIVISCMPSIRLILVHIFPALRRSETSSQQHGKYESGYKRSKSTRGHTSGDFISLDSMPSEHAYGPKVQYQKSGGVTYGENEP